MGADRASWEQPLDLAELGELTALWLEGAISTPMYGGGPDEETIALMPALVAMNRNGYVTDFSQPGEKDRGWWQRAAVSGHCTRREADRLAALFLESELIVITEFPRHAADLRTADLAGQRAREHSTRRARLLRRA
jgi:hypothetical protein